MSAASLLRSTDSHAAPLVLAPRLNSTAQPFDTAGRPLRAFAVGTLLSAICWTAIAVAVLHEPTRRLVVESWPLGVVVAVALAARLLVVTRRRHVRPLLTLVIAEARENPTSS